MADNYGDMLDDGPPSQAATEQRPEGKEGDEQQGVLVNKELAPNAEVGQTFMVRVVGVHDNELSIVMEEQENEEKPPTESGNEEMAPSGGDEYASMME